ncbi:MAG: hypothetical protein FJ086_13960 [Deltaproteobacteria bacterium]|nr:hypothetical protein [Deltaproteobacteria bacterium]
MSRREKRLERKKKRNGPDALLLEMRRMLDLLGLPRKLVGRDDVVDHYLHSLESISLSPSCDDAAGRRLLNDIHIHGARAQVTLSCGIQFPLKLLPGPYEVLLNLLQDRGVHREHPDPLVRGKLAQLLGNRRKDLAAVEPAFERSVTTALIIGSDITASAIYGARFGPLRALVIERTSGQSRDFNIRGRSRQAFRLGGPADGMKGMEWVDWASDRVGLPPGRTMPVYVQAHAQTRTRERLKQRVGAPGAWHRDLIFTSLRNPVIHKGREPGTWLVEARVPSATPRGLHKLGYFLVTVQGDAVLVHTFLFLTMDGTPEGTELRRRLHLAPRDVAHLSLDTLELFLDPSVRNSPALRNALVEAGCGGLLGLGDDWQETGLQGQAPYLERYLRLPAVPPTAR